MSQRYYIQLASTDTRAGGGLIPQMLEPKEIPTEYGTHEIYTLWIVGPNEKKKLTFSVKVEKLSEPQQDTHGPAHLRTGKL